MAYKKEWRGKLRILSIFRVEWEGVLIGETHSYHYADVESPDGVSTNTIWYAISRFSGKVGEHTSKNNAIQGLVDIYLKEVVGVS